MILAIPNLSATLTAEVRPWECDDRMPAEIASGDKASRGRWQLDGNTVHTFYNVHVGVNPGLRVNSDNPVAEIRGLIADYDARVPVPDLVVHLKAEFPEDARPAWCSITRSGGARLLWVFEKPLPVSEGKLLTEFLYKTGRRLKLSKVLPGWDEAAWSTPTTFYELATKWQPVGSETSVEVANYWLYEAASSLKPDDWGTQEDIELPFSTIQDEFERRWPGRWKGAWSEGARSVVPFDPSSVNTTAAILTAKGLVCFGQARMFYAWKELFGHAFIDKYQADRLGGAVEGVWFDGTKFYRKDMHAIWRGYNTEAMRRYLTLAGLSDKAGKKQPLSEVDRAIAFVEQNKFVDALAPVLFDERDVVHERGKVILNTARVRAMRPASAAPEVWGEGFPWLARFFDTFFVTEGGREWFLAWLKVYWTGALAGKLARGHALFIVGPVASGKTFLSGVIVSQIVGGHYPASNFLRGVTSWTAELFEKSLLTCDDASMSASEAEATAFSSAVKQLVVNPQQEHRVKFRNEVSLDWSGRCIVSLNDDAVSARILPNFDESIRDKLGVLRVQTPDVDFDVSYSKNETRVASELPSFLAWLQTWDVPKELKGGRLGIKELIDPATEALGAASKGATTVLDYADIYTENFLNADGKKWPITGKATEILAQFSVCDKLRGLLNKETAVSFGRKLATLATTDDRVEIVGRPHGTLQFEIREPKSLNEVA